MPKVSTNKLPASRHWCFTWNNYTPENEQHIQSLSIKDNIEFLRYGCETAPTTGTPHLQGYVILPKKKLPSTIRKIIGGGHFIKSFGNKARRQPGLLC
jgi:Putative viral replication protein